MVRWIFLLMSQSSDTKHKFLGEINILHIFFTAEHIAALA